MPKDLGITPQDLRSTAEHLTDVSTRMKGVITNLNGKLDGEGPAWGDDETGHQFADGQEGYLSQKEWVKGSVDAKTKLLDDYSKSLRTTADTLEQTDNV